MMYIHRYTTHTRAIHCTRIGLSSAFLDFMVSKETKIAKISEALEGATVKQLDEIIGILAPQGDRRRFLQPTLSEAKDDESARAERLDLCHTQKRRRMEQLAEGTYYVAPTKTSVRFAVTWWTEQSSLYHPPLFLLTALIRLVFVDVKGLRQYSVTKHWCLNIIRGVLADMFECCVGCTLLSALCLLHFVWFTLVVAFCCMLLIGFDCGAECCECPI